MAWSLEMEEQLKKLWADGLSCSQIAKKIGGVSRNAVIGKVHRLGLSGRANPARPTLPKRGRTKALSAPKSHSGGGSRRRAKVLPAPEPVKLPDPEPMDNGEFANVLTIKDSMCKWPIGDPSEPGFRFCGHRATGPSPYCEAHQQIAFAEPKKRRRTTDARAVLDSIQAARRVNF